MSHHFSIENVTTERLPRRTVADCKDPTSDDDLFGSGQGADELRLDRMTDRDVSFNCEGRQRQC